VLERRGGANKNNCYATLNVNTLTFQEYANRQFFSKHLPVGEDRRRITFKGKPKDIFTQLVVVVSNFHFNKRAQGIDNDIVCTPVDCYISLKFSSTKFKADGGTEESGEPTGADGQEFYFDREYVYFSFQSFAALLINQDLKKNWWPLIKKKFEEATSIPLDVEADRAGQFEIDDDDDLEDEGNTKKTNIGNNDDDDDDDDDEVQVTRKAGKQAAKRLQSSDEDEEEEEEVGKIGGGKGKAAKKAAGKKKRVQTK